MPLPTENPPLEARLDAVELLLREVLCFTLGRRAIVDRALLAVGALEREAFLSGDQGRQEHAAAVRDAVERMTE